MQSNKYLYIWLGLVLMIFSFIRFYNQPLPPNSELMHKVYNYLHGGEKFPARRGDWYSNTSFYFEASRQVGKYYYIIHNFQFIDKNVVFNFTIKPSQPKRDIRIDNLFPDPVIGAVKNDQLLSYYPILRKEIKQSEGIMTAALFFPLIDRSADEIKFWYNYSRNELLFDLLNKTDAPQAKGTTVWGIVFLAGVGLFLKGISSNPIKVMRKVLVKEVNALDEEKNKSLECILGGSGSFKKLSEKDQNRYSSTTSFYDQIQNVTVDFYKYLPFKKTSSFEQGFQLFLLLSLVLLSAVMIFFCFKLIIDPRVSIDRLFGDPGIYSNFPVEIRIADLEVTKSTLSKFLAGFMLFGIVSIVANYLLSAWRVKQVANQVVGLRLMGYEKTLTTQIKAKTKTTDASLATIERKIGGIEEKHDSRLSEASSLRRWAKIELELSVDSRMREMKKGFKKHFKAFKRELKNHLKRKKERNAED